MNTRRLILFLSMAGLLTGCAQPNLTFHDASGVIIARGDLSIPDPLPPSGDTFEGTWHLRSHTDAFPSDAVSSGRYRGTVTNRGVWIDLNRRAYDHNVFLDGSISADALSGSWGIALFAGPKELGTFVLTRAAR